MPGIEKGSVNDLNVLYQSDCNTQIGLGTSIISLLINNQHLHNITIYLIDNGIESSFLSELRQCVFNFQRKINVIPASLLLENELVKQYPCYTGKRKNKNSYLKLFWQLGIEEAVDRLLYIDCDTVINNDLASLVGVEMGDKPIGMAYDALITDEIERIGLGPTDQYYNSGIILFNAQRWIEDQCSYRIIQHFKENGSYGTVDQDVLNLVFRNQICTLPIRYNFQPIHFMMSALDYMNEFKRKNYYGLEEILIEEKEICIIHFLKFLGQNVWDKDNLNPGKKYFEKYVKQTPWRTEIKESHVAPVFVLEKILYRILPKRLFLKIFHFAHRLMINRANGKRIL